MKLHPACVAVAVAALASTVSADPAANTCPAAPLINANQMYYGTNVGATSDITQSSCSHYDTYDVWYRFTAGNAGAYTIDTAGSAIDTTLTTFNDCGGPELACCDDCGAGLDAVLTMSLAAGQTVRIRIAAFAFESGSFNLFITPPVVPAIGACCRGAGCEVIAAADCISETAHFCGAGSTCNASGNSTYPCCRADFDHSGEVTVDDAYDYLTDWVPQSTDGDAILGSADINSSGAVTVQDLYDFFAAWIDGCP